MLQGFSESNRHEVLWDGGCGFCGRAMNWIERRDDGSQLEFIPYQAIPTPPMTPELAKACAYALHVRTRDGEMIEAGRATLFVLDQVGFTVLARILGLRPFVWGFELAYWILARNRHVFGRFLFRGEAPRHWNRPTP